MTGRGSHPRLRWLLVATVAVGAGAILELTGSRALEALATAAATQHDKLPWYATRVLAFLSYLAITGSVVYGLLLSTKLLDAIAHRPVSFALHQDLAAIGLGLAGVHAMLLTLDHSVPFSLAAVLIPFTAPYRPLWVGLGQVALDLTLVVVASFYLRRRIGQRTWRLLHHLTFLAFAGSTLHGVLSGTDTGTPWAWWIYVGSSAIVVFLVTYRVAITVQPGGRRAGHAVERSTGTASGLHRA